MNSRPLLVLAALGLSADPDLGKDVVAKLKSGFRERYTQDPMGTTAATVLLASALFYRAERDHNPKVKTFHDALVYVATNLSVGYSDVLAKTPSGKAIGSALMTFGPAMAARILDRPAGEASRDENTAALQALVERLDRLLERVTQRDQTS